MFGMTYAVVALTKELEIGKNGQLVTAGTGEMVKTTATGAQVHFEPSELAQRKLRAYHEGNRDLQTRSFEAGDIIGYIPVEDAEAAWDVASFGAVMTVTLTDVVDNKERQVTIDRNDAYRYVETETEPKGTFYYFVKREGHPNETYTVDCYENELKCSIITDQDLEDVNCFSPEATVRSKAKGVIAMKDLQVGDEILASGGKYETVYSIPHADSSRPQVFLQIKSDVADNVAIELSDDHLIYVYGKKHPFPASEIKVGDYLVDSNGSATKVTMISKVLRKGIYAPLTPSGTMIVDGVQVSSYALIQHGTSSPEYTEWMGIRWWSQNDFARLYATPHRWYWMYISPMLDLNPPRNEDGIWSHM